MNKLQKYAAIGLCSIGLELCNIIPTAAATFIQCDSYVNVHVEPYLQSSLVGYMYNDNLIEEILEEQQGWIKIKSGNVQGWISKEYTIQSNSMFKNGYTIAKIHPKSLTVYTAPDKKSTPYTTVYQGQEIECVEYKDDWLTLAFEDGSYGFIDAYEAELNTYYGTGETIEENQSNSYYEDADLAEEYCDPGYEYYYEESENYYIEPQPEEFYYNYSETVETNTQTYVESQSESIYIEPEIFNTQSVSANSDIVSYADQFIGNPYLYGGNSLTDGIDCSHFVYQVLTNTGHYDGGYATSDGWASLGSSVSSLDEAVAGDVIVYPGHVAIYDGEGGIVQAQGSEAGITHSRDADYKDIIAIRHFD